MYLWTPESIRFRIDAAEQTGYDDAIIAQLLPELSGDSFVCDAGCGLGYTSLALAQVCARVTAVDTSQAALDVLRANMLARNVRNIDVVKGDLFSMRPERMFDAMVFCFFGRVEETLRAAKAQCTGTVYMIKKNWQNHRFTPGSVPLGRFTFQQTLQELDTLRVPYRARTVPIEMGQPFRSLEDAVRFFELYRQQGDEQENAEDRVKQLLTTTNSEAFPFFLSASSELGIVAVDVKDINLF